MTEKTPELKRSPYPFYEWMVAIPFGITPDGKKITRIHFVDEVSDGREGRLADFDKDEFVGEVTFLGIQQWPGATNGYVHMTPGSILVSYGSGSHGTLVERPGECVIWVYPHNTHNKK
ncbi:MAG: hypothetical protein Q7S95_02415 [bacterium]|nr:hypothetical protein [bacterium]